MLAISNRISRLCRAGATCSWHRTSATTSLARGCARSPPSTTRRPPISASTTSSGRSARLILCTDRDAQFVQMGDVALRRGYILTLRFVEPVDFGVILKFDAQQESSCPTPRSPPRYDSSARRSQTYWRSQLGVHESEQQARAEALPLPEDIAARYYKHGALGATPALWRRSSRRSGPKILQCSRSGNLHRSHGQLFLLHRTRPSEMHLQAQQLCVGRLDATLHLRELPRATEPPSGRTRETRPTLGKSGFRRRVTLEQTHIVAARGHPVFCYLERSGRTSSYIISKIACFNNRPPQMSSQPSSSATCDRSIDSMQRF